MLFAWILHGALKAISQKLTFYYPRLFNKLIYGIIIIIKLFTACIDYLQHVTPCKISISVSYLNWVKNEMIFYYISELILPTLIQRYYK